MNYTSFEFIGHGKINSTGGYDPGASYGSYREHNIATELVNRSKAYLSGVNIQYGVNNYENELLNGNSYTAKCGSSIHINAGGGEGIEIIVPCGESYLVNEEQLLKDISAVTGLKIRGLKSRDYDTGNFISRKHGEKLSNKDYYKEIRQAWQKGVSLAIIEVGFIDTADITKIINNYEKIALCLANYTRRNAGIEDYKAPSTPTPQPPTTAGKEIYYRAVAGSFKDRAAAEKRVQELKNKGYTDAFIVSFEK